LEAAELELQNQYSSLIQAVKTNNSHFSPELEKLVSLYSLGQNINLLIVG
jgi:hypothetical protein